MAEFAPRQDALILPVGRDGDKGARYRHITFGELEQQSNRYANGLATVGLRRGTRVVVMVRPGAEFIGLIFALFKVGAVPILIDPGMGLGRMLECIRFSGPEALIGIPPAHALRRFRPGAFRAVRHAVTVGRRWFWGGPTLDRLAGAASDAFDPAPTRPDEAAAILFTSGSTGPAKGVTYEHGMFEAQVHAIRDAYGIEPGEIDLPAFPLFALFSTAMGMTSVIPDMDPSRPAMVNPARIVEAIRDHAVTNTFGSPAIWDRVSCYCADRGITLPTLRRVLIAGAPVSWRVIERMHRILDSSADVHTPYGATESLPASSISGREVLRDCCERSRQGAGTCVGRPLPGITLRIIRITDRPIETWSDDLVLPDGEIGEVVVSGDVVTKQYDGLPQATAQAKIKDGDGVRHRVGDVGYLDPQGRLWFCGRKAHRVTAAHGTMFSVPCEAVFNEHPDVVRSALVGVGPAGEQQPIIIVEPEPGKFPSGRRVPEFERELLEMGARNELTKRIDRVLFYRAFPVDVRHNAKINREALADWAAERLR